jgi:hypothetical protein
MDFYLQLVPGLFRVPRSPSYHVVVIQCHRIETTEARLLDFSYDFGVTAIRHQNADAIPSQCAYERHEPP